VKPTVVFVELDEARARALRSNTTQNYADNLFAGFFLSFLSFLSHYPFCFFFFVCYFDLAFQKRQPFGQAMLETFMKSIYSVAKGNFLVLRFSYNVDP
jgi:hypothetical protein